MKTQHWLCQLVSDYQLISIILESLQCFDCFRIVGRKAKKFLKI